MPSLHKDIVLYVPLLPPDYLQFETVWIFGRIKAFLCRSVEVVTISSWACLTKVCAGLVLHMQDHFVLLVVQELM